MIAKITEKPTRAHPGPGPRVTPALSRVNLGEPLRRCSPPRLPLVVNGGGRGEPNLIPPNRAHLGPRRL